MTDKINIDLGSYGFALPEFDDELDVDMLEEATVLAARIEHLTQKSMKRGLEAKASATPSPEARRPTPNTASGHPRSLTQNRHHSHRSQSSLLDGSAQFEGETSSKSLPVIPIPDPPPPHSHSAASGVSYPKQPTSSGERPPAAATQVRAMAATLAPLVLELMPLPPPRRARRFWARWREVVGDLGVRRDVVEDLLESASSPEHLLAELIAETQAVNVQSVHFHLTQFLASDTIA